MNGCNDVIFLQVKKYELWLLLFIIIELENLSPNCANINSAIKALINCIKKAVYKDRKLITIPHKQIKKERHPLPALLKSVN